MEHPAPVVLEPLIEILFVREDDVPCEDAAAPELRLQHDLQPQLVRLADRPRHPLVGLVDSAIADGELGRGAGEGVGDDRHRVRSQGADAGELLAGSVRAIAVLPADLMRERDPAQKPRREGDRGGRSLRARSDQNERGAENQGALGCCLHAPRLSQTCPSAQSFPDPSALPGKTLELAHLVHGLFQPAKPFRGSQPEPEPDVVTASSSKIPDVFLAVGLAFRPRWSSHGAFSPSSTTTSWSAVSITSCSERTEPSGIQTRSR